MVITINCTSFISCYGSIKFGILNFRYPLKKEYLASELNMAAVIGPESAVAYCHVTEPTIKWSSILLCRIIIEMAVF